MGPFASRALLVDSALVSTALLILALFLYAAPVESRSRVARFDTIEVGRIDIRDPDGTLRLAISSAAQAPGIIVKNEEFPHPKSQERGPALLQRRGDRERRTDLRRAPRRGQGDRRRQPHVRSRRAGPGHATDRRIVNKKSLSEVKDRDLIGSMAAMKRAAQHAREDAIMTGTAVVVMLNGKLVRVTAAELKKQQRSKRNEVA